MNKDNKMVMREYCVKVKCVYIYIYVDRAYTLVTELLWDNTFRVKVTPIVCWYERGDKINMLLIMSWCGVSTGVSERVVRRGDNKH